MPHRKWLMTAGSLVLAIAAGWAVLKSRQGDGKGPVQPALPEARTNDRAESRFPATPPKTTGAANLKPARPPQPAATTSPEEIDRILEHVHTAAVTYDAAQLPEIDPYLLHPNQEIRTAALDAMVTLGDAAAAPLLRTAAARAPSPHEAVALLEAADYVELPSAKLTLRKRTKSSTAAIPPKKIGPAHPRSVPKGTTERGP